MLQYFNIYAAFLHYSAILPTFYSIPPVRLLFKYYSAILPAFYTITPFYQLWPSVWKNHFWRIFWKQCLKYQTVVQYLGCWSVHDSFEFRYSFASYNRCNRQASILLFWRKQCLKLSTMLIEMLPYNPVYVITVTGTFANEGKNTLLGLFFYFFRTKKKKKKRWVKVQKDIN